MVRALFDQRVVAKFYLVSQKEREMMYALHVLQENCANMSATLNDSFSIEECKHILTSRLDPYVIEYAASTLVATLAHRISRVLSLRFAS